MHAGMTTLIPHHAYGYEFQDTEAKIQQDEEAAENQALEGLLAEYPGVSHEEIACRYIRAVNAAGGTLSTRQTDIMKSPTGLCLQKRYVMNSGGLPAVGSDDLLLEKYGRGVNELICREPRTPIATGISCTKRSPASYSPHMHKQNISGAWGNSTIGNGVVAMSQFLKKRKKRRDGVEIDEEDDSPFQAEEDFLLYLLGEDFPLHKDVISDVLGHFGGDTDKSLEWLLEMASSHSGFGLKTSLDIHKSVMTNSKLYLDQKLAVKRDPLHPLGANQHKDSLPTLNKYQGHNGNVEEDPNILLKYGEGVSKNQTSQGALSKQMVDRFHSEVKVLFDQLKILFPAATNNYLFAMLQRANFNLRDAEKSISVAFKSNSTNCSHAKKFNTQTGHGAARTTSRPLRALWADKEPTITPLEQTNGVVSAKESPSEFGFGGTTKPMFKSYGDFDDYGRCRKSANEHWNLMKYYFDEAAAAYGRGEKCRAAELSEKGKEYKQLAQEASERASNRLFDSRNKDIENNITIDLHAQHVNEALEHLKRHLQSFSSIPLVNMVTIITGHGSHSIDGRARVKPAVINYLSDCSIPWQELNDGCLTIKMKDVRNKQDMFSLV